RRLRRLRQPGRWRRRLSHRRAPRQAWPPLGPHARPAPAACLCRPAQAVARPTLAADERLDGGAARGRNRLAMQTIAIDRSKHRADEPATGHNRWHPAIEPLVEVGAGEEVALQTRDALDGYLDARSTVADFGSVPLGAVHPLTGPVAVKGARP